MTGAAIKPIMNLWTRSSWKYDIASHSGVDWRIIDRGSDWFMISNKHCSGYKHKPLGTSGKWWCMGKQLANNSTVPTIYAAKLSRTAVVYSKQQARNHWQWLTGTIVGLSMVIMANTLLWPITSNSCGHNWARTRCSKSTCSWWHNHQTYMAPYGRLTFQDLI